VGRVLVDEDETVGALGHQVSRPDLADWPEHGFCDASSDFGYGYRSCRLVQGELGRRVTSNRGRCTTGGVILVRLAPTEDNANRALQR